MEPTRFINGEGGNVADETTKATLLDIFGAGVIHNGACLVVLVDEAKAPEGSPVADFVAELRALSHLQFAC
eukprot:5446218-Alexandrium_andersonii.AAC.1